MKDSTKEKIVLLTLNDSTKIQGVLIKIDKENLKIILEKGKFINADGATTSFDQTEIFKKDIKEIRLVEEKEKPKEPEVQPITKTAPIKDDMKEEGSLPFSSIPLNIQEKYQDDSSKYDKGGFFDTLIIANNKDNFKEIKTYNEKNKETFGLDDNYYNNGNKRGARGGGFSKRGRRGNNNNGRGGGYGGYSGGRGGYYGNNDNHSNYSSSYGSGYSTSQYGIRNENSSYSNNYSNYRGGYGGNQHYNNNSYDN